MLSERSALLPEPIPLWALHPLVGTWRDPDPYGSSVRYSVRATPYGFDVSGIDLTDDERLEISDTSWDGRVLRFVSLTRSTGHRVEHSLSAIDRDRVRHTFSYVEDWVRPGA